ncbi:Component of a membrane-bound complex containing the Tor2p kinase [Coniosporium tulheliwenetii]|uniref:Component of a membrane-bound complex containing the Tor2p kinase n=1 Tax=Coniosporium tulheliwenetii TaxID=3383036 RepID=A0ACC2YWY2_9PEZI|nr:Component of a membrane-bound complex containing the Tor2p kinase [Cladosporium sp. JES 115]
MSLLQNEEFVLYQLRTAYLSCIKDGVGERLINVNTSVLNNPAFRAAGWAPNAADIKRTYSPPIPTAVASEYFQAPRSAGLTGSGFGDEDDEGGMVTGGEGAMILEDDSSDLSDESDEDLEAAQRAAQQIRFNKMPVRTRAGSSPLRSSNLKDGPALLVTSLRDLQKAISFGVGR